MSQNLTREQAITKHRQMWNWIADKTLIRKRRITKQEYFNENLGENEEQPLVNCYACQYSAEQSGIISFSDNICQFCPIDWNSNAHCLMCLYSDDSLSDNVFTLWQNTIIGNWENAAELARQIAELPERMEE